MLSTNTVKSPKTEPITNLEWALKYASMGLRVFPLQPSTKVPMTAHGVKDATDNPLVIKEWWTETPDAGIGLAARAEKVGDPCFLEFDQKPWLPAWAKELGQEKPVTRLHKSGGKESPHYIFRHTEKSMAMGNCDGAKDGHEWFSFRAANRYIVAPPSIHPDSGKPYTVELDVEPVPIPDWLVGAIANKGRREREFANDMPELDEDFDFEAFCDWIPAKLGDEDGSWYAFEECPVAGRRHKGQGVRGCALYYDGGKLGFKCHAAECPSNVDRRPDQSGIGFLVSFLSRENGAYEGVIWPEREDQFGAIDAGLVEKLIESIGGEPIVPKPAELAPQTVQDDEVDEPKPMPQVTIDYLKKNSEAAMKAQEPQPEEVQEVEPATIPDYKAPKKMYPMPEECMYGWIGDFCRTLGCPLQVAYPIALAFFAGNGIPYYRSGGEEVRTNLNVCAIGPKGWGKSRTYKRIKMSFVYSVPGQIIEKYPGSEIGLVELLGGKKAKDEDEVDMLSKSFLLYQDELRSTFTKAGIENSALPFMINHLFSEDEYGTASKRGHYVCHPKLSIIGGLTCDQSGEFADVFGKATTNGTYDRFIFTETPEWEFDDKWKPVHDDLVNFRRPKGCRVPDVVFDMKRDWVAKNRESRMRLGEIALRIALVSASMNHDSAVSEECMEKALMFCEWQEAVRYKYRPSDMDSVDGKCQEAIERALKLHPGKFISWRKLCTKYHLYRHGATVLGRVYKAMVAEGMMEEASKDSEAKDGRKTKRVKYVKLAD